MCNIQVRVNPATLTSRQFFAYGRTRAPESPRAERESGLSQPDDCPKVVGAEGVAGLQRCVLGALVVAGLGDKEAAGKTRAHRIDPSLRSWRQGAAFGFVQDGYRGGFGAPLVAFLPEHPLPACGRGYNPAAAL
jgi:hypothetical protein